VRYLTPAPDAPEPTETAVIAAIPDAEPLVGKHRQHLDAAATWGMPAHVTVLYPFVPPTAMSSQAISILAAATPAAARLNLRLNPDCRNKLA
jgi:hypothetical protein